MAQSQGQRRRNRQRRDREQQNGNGNGLRDRTPKQQTWVIGEVLDENGDMVGLDRDAVREGLANLEPIGHEMGGSFVVTPLKVATGPHPLTQEATYTTLAWHVKRIGFVPPAALPEQQRVVPAAFEASTEVPEDFEPRITLDDEPDDVAALRAELDELRAERAAVAEQQAPSEPDESDRPVEVGSRDEAASITAAG